MSISHTSGLCIDIDQGLLEGLPAEWDIFPDEGYAELQSYRIGCWTGDRNDAISMTGKDHIEKQEAIVFAKWYERNRHDSDDTDYDLRKENA